MSDARLDLPFPIWISHPARHCYGAIVLEQIAVQRIERRIVKIRREHAFAQVVEDHDTRRSAKATKGLLVKLGPDLYAGAEPQEPDALPAVSERHHEQPGPAVLAGLRIPDHGAGAVINLPFLTRGGFNHHSGLG